MNENHYEEGNEENAANGSGGDQGSHFSKNH